MVAFQVEAQASTKYALFGVKAREEGYQQISNIFDETSRNELVHAMIWYKLLHGGEIPDTMDNLKEAYETENYEWSSMYTGFAEEAKKEGHIEIGQLFELASRIERHADARFRKLSYNVRWDKVFCKDEASAWVCIGCGNIVYDVCAPEICAFCGGPRGSFEQNCENY
jgi:rubrerythrin